MAQRMTTAMASAMALAVVHDMAHSTPLHYVSGHPSIRATETLPGPDRDGWMGAPRQIGGQSCP
jgi:hypothetical protein